MTNKVIKILSDILKVKVTENTNRDDTHDWDSTNHLDIIMTLEEEFKIDIPMNCFSALSSVKNIVEYLKENKCS